jgi:hypothetical protein
MTKSIKKSRTTNSHFIYIPGTDGCEETFDVVCLKTGDVFASLPYWYQEKETLRDTRLLIRALNRLHARGGHFFAAPLLQTLQSLEMLIGHDSAADVNLGGRYVVA